MRKKSEKLEAFKKENVSTNKLYIDMFAFDKHRTFVDGPLSIVEHKLIKGTCKDYNKNPNEENLSMCRKSFELIAKGFKVFPNVRDVASLTDNEIKELIRMFSLYFNL